MAGIHFIGPNTLSYNPPAAGGGQVTDSLVYAYDANIWDQSATLSDESPNGYDLSENGTVSVGTDGGGGKYFDFTNSSNYFNATVSGMGLSNSNAYYTVEFIVKPLNSGKFTDGFAGIWGTGQNIFTWNYWNYDTSVGGVYTGGLVPYFGGFNYVAQNPPVVYNTWMHLVQVTDATIGNFVQFYNGTKYNSTFEAGSQGNWPSGIITPSSKNFTFGKQQTSSGSPNVYVAAHRFYNKALSDAEVAQQYAYWSSQGYSGL